MRHVGDAVLHLRDGPRHHVIERQRPCEIERGKLVRELDAVEARRHRTRGDPQRGFGEQRGQRFIPIAALFGGRKKRVLAHAAPRWTASGATAARRAFSCAR